MRAVQCVKAMNAAKEANAKKKLDAAMKAMKAATVADAPRVAMKTMKAKDAPRMKPRGAMKTMKSRKAMKAQQPRGWITPYYRGVIEGLRRAERPELAWGLEPADVVDPLEGAMVPIW